MNIYAGWPVLVLRHHRTWFEDRLDTGATVEAGDVRLALAGINAELARQVAKEWQSAEHYDLLMQLARQTEQAR